MKKKKKKSSGTPKKAARRAAPGAVKKVKKGPVGKGPASKPKKTKPGAGKKGKKAPPTSAKKGKPTAATSQPICVQNFPASNNSQVCFTGIPAAGCTLSQITGDIFPFSPVTGTANGLDYTNLTQANNCVIVVVPALNKTYPYNVSCCGNPSDDPAHSVTVNS